MASVQESKVNKVKRVKYMVMPFDLQCETCGRRVTKGDKFNGLKEEIGTDPTFDVEVYRYTFRCLCRATFSIKSDPGRYDYVPESGAILVPKKV